MMFSNIHKQTSPFMLMKKQQQKDSQTNKAPATVSFGFSKQYLAANRPISEPQRSVPTPPPPVVSDREKMRWGSAIWKFLHVMADKIKENEFAEKKNEILTMIYSICSVLPCPICSEHAKRYLQGINMNRILTKEDLKMMLYNFHNDVNKRKGYAIFNKDDLGKYEGVDFVSSVNEFFYYFEDKHRSAKLMADDMIRSETSKIVKKWIMKNVGAFM